jgi:hypothetical protein
MLASPNDRALLVLGVIVAEFGTVQRTTKTYFEDTIQNK